MIKRQLSNYIIISLAFLISTISISCSGKADNVASASWSAEDAGDTILAVEVLEISKGKLYPSVKASALISGIQEAYVISETSGVIEEAKFEIGDKVEKNDLLLRVDDKIAQLSMEQAMQQYETARIDLDSIEAFYSKGNASSAELARARSTANGARAQYETARKVYEDSSLNSPITGAVAWKDPETAMGNYLNRGMRVAKIVDMSSFRIELSLGERQIGLIESGAKADVFIQTVWGDKPIPGRVIAIAAGSDSSTGSFPVIVEAENIVGDALRAGMSSAVLIETRNQSEEIIVPSSSIVVRSGKEYVFLDIDGSAKAVEIEKGKMFGNRTIINSGLSEGDQIIISGLSALRPESKVQSRIIGKTGDLQ